MKTKNSLILGSLLFFSATVFSQAQEPKPATAAPDKAQTEKTKQAAGQPSDKDMQVWMSYMTPGEMHKMLASANGDWHEELTMWMAPGQPPTKAEAECTNSMIFGDRYQESIHKGQMMGMPFEGKSTVGYDNARKIFQSTWVDNRGTGIMYTEGKYDPKTNSINLSGTCVDPGTGKMEKVREVMKFVDDKTQMMEMYMTKDGKEFKTMEIKFTKK
jgi:hypothetical protein